MIDTGRNRRLRIATVFGILVAVGTLLVLAIVPAETLALRLERQAVSLTADHSCAVGLEPMYGAYDPVDQETYVPNFGTGTITVLEGTCTVAATITLPNGAEPVQAVFDPSDNDVFVTDYFLNQIYVISGTKVVTTYADYGYLNEPWGIAYAQSDFPDYGGAIFVTNLGSPEIEGFLTPLNKSFAPFASFGVSAPANLIAYDSGDGLLWWTVPSTNSVGTFNFLLWTQWDDGYPPFTWLPSLFDNFAVGSTPTDLAVDLSNGYIYVTNEASYNVTVLDGSLSDLGTTIGTISGFDEPDGVAWDQSNLRVYVTNFASSLDAGQVFVIGGSSGLSILKVEYTSVSSQVNGISYDAANGKMYATGWGNGKVYVLA